MYPQGGAYTRAVESEKSLAPLCPIGGEALVTYHCCIIFSLQDMCEWVSDTAADAGETRGQDLVGQQPLL